MPAPPLFHPGPWPLVSWDIRPYQDIDLRDWTVKREWVEVSASISLEPGEIQDRSRCGCRKSNSPRGSGMITPLNERQNGYSICFSQMRSE
jgi:hypothetical protein